MDSRVKIKREGKNEKSMWGQLYIDNKSWCYTLEHPIRDIKIPKLTGIPSGIYKLEINFSNHFKRAMVQIFDVPGFEGVRLHGGNLVEDSEGCVLIAHQRIDHDTIQSTAEKDFILWLKCQKEPVYLEIINLF